MPGFCSLAEAFGQPKTWLSQPYTELLGLISRLCDLKQPWSQYVFQCIVGIIRGGSWCRCPLIMLNDPSTDSVFAISQNGGTPLGQGFNKWHAIQEYIGIQRYRSACFQRNNIYAQGRSSINGPLPKLLFCLHDGFGWVGIPSFVNRFRSIACSAIPGAEEIHQPIAQAHSSWLHGEPRWDNSVPGRWHALIPQTIKPYWLWMDLVGITSSY